ncbi:MAG: efflux RND transporter periplasmic adaptor subunit [Candidatus Eremiobacteraeota bacterium]|nr:efflux RND transporter periplasmic adaptor subunit [Candidatus Eremiobacteraeota bacterium]
MKRLAVFFWALLLISLADIPLPASASPMVERVGTAQVMLTLSPDPPAAGTVHGTIHVSGASADMLSHTTVRFQTNMTSMGMSGPAGVTRAGTARGEYVFDAALGMAASWAVVIRFSGALHGSATFRFAVMEKSNAGGSGMGPDTHGSSMSGMAGMSGSSSTSSGNPDAWRNALFALIALMLIGVFVLRRDRSPKVAGLFVAAGLIILVLAILQNRYTAPATDMSSMSNMKGTGATPVTLTALRSGRNSTDVFAPGAVQPYLTQDIVTRAPGILQNFNLYAGDHVGAGQVLATLDAPELGNQAQAAYANAQAQAATARAAEIQAHHHAPAALSIAQNEAASSRTDLAAAFAEQHAKSQQLRYWNDEINREQILYSQGAVSQQELQDERAQAAAATSAYQGAVEHVASLQQQVQAAQSRTLDASATIAMTQQQAQAAQALADQAASAAAGAGTMAAYRTVISPNDAVVVRRLVDPGVYVQAGTPILRIAVINRLRIQANVAQEDLSGITIGTPMEARLSSGKVLRGRVSSLSPAADPTTHTAAVEAIVPGVGSDIPPGGYVRVRLHAREVSTAGALAVPSVAIVGGGSDAAVWIDNSGTAHRVHVQVLSDDGTTAFVKGPLPHDARVVTDGASTLEEGQPIAERHA